MPFPETRCLLLRDIDGLNEIWSWRRVGYRVSTRQLVARRFAFLHTPPNE
jgi:hypothetical protein